LLSRGQRGALHLSVAEGETQRMRTKWLKRIALFSFILALALPPVASAQSAADLYKTKCQSCHGPGGTPSEGMAKAMGLKPLSAADVQGMSDSDLAGAITSGKGKMPAFKGKLTDAQIKDMVTYIRTLKK
jgi:mono/diheme cytochrome c family protein